MSFSFLLIAPISCQVPIDEVADRQETLGEDEISSELLIGMKDSRFEPDIVTVSRGTTITWFNEDSIIHTIAGGKRENGSVIFSSGNITDAQAFSYTFHETGIFDYYCSLHPGMDGTIIVE